MKILVPLDGSRLSDAVVSHVRRLFHGQREACEAHLLHVTEPASRPGTRGEMRMHLAALARVLEADGLRTLLRVVSGDPVAEILETVVDDHIDLVAMATHGTGGTRPIGWGSVAECVVRACPVAVLLVNPAGLVLHDDETQYRRVVLALDERGLVPGAVEQAAALAAGAGAELTVLLNKATDPTTAHRELERLGVPAARVVPLHGPPARAILAQAREREADLLALSGRPRSPLAPWPLDRVIEAVARTAPCPVLFLRASAPAPVAR